MGPYKRLNTEKCYRKAVKHPEKINKKQYFMEAIKHPILAYRTGKKISRLRGEEVACKEALGEEDGEKLWEDLFLKLAIGEKPNYEGIRNIVPQE